MRKEEQDALHRCFGHGGCGVECGGGLSLQPAEAQTCSVADHISGFGSHSKYLTDNGNGSVTWNNGHGQVETYYPCAAAPTVSANQPDAGPVQTPSRYRNAPVQSTTTYTPPANPLRARRGVEGATFLPSQTGEDRQYSVLVSELFSGEGTDQQHSSRLRYDVSSSADSVATVSDVATSCDRSGDDSTPAINFPCITVTGGTPAPNTTAPRVTVRCNDSNVPPCGQEVKIDVPYEEHEAEITVTATNSVTGETASVTFTVTVLVEPS